MFVSDVITRGAEGQCGYQTVMPREAGWPQSLAPALTGSPFGSCLKQNKQAEGQPLELDLSVCRRGPERTEPTVGTWNGSGADSGPSLDTLVSWSERPVSPSSGEPQVGNLGSSGAPPAHQVAELECRPWGPGSWWRRKLRTLEQGPRRVGPLEYEGVH